MEFRRNVSSRLLSRRLEGSEDDNRTIKPRRRGNLGATSLSADRRKGKTAQLGPTGLDRRRDYSQMLLVV